MLFGFAGIPLFIGIVFILISKTPGLIVGRLKKKGAATTATVVEIQRESVNSGGGKGNIYRVEKSTHGSYFPVLQFEVDGTVWTERGSIGLDKPRYRLGQQIQVYYDPANPRNVVVEGDDNSSAFRAFGVIGWILLVIGAAVLIIVGTITLSV